METAVGTIVAPRKREEARKALLGFKRGRCNEGATTMGRCLNSYSMRILENFRNYNLVDGTRLELSGCGFVSRRASLES